MPRHSSLLQGLLTLLLEATTFVAVASWINDTTKLLKWKSNKTHMLPLYQHCWSPVYTMQYLIRLATSRPHAFLSKRNEHEATEPDDEVSRGRMIVQHHTKSDKGLFPKVYPLKLMTHDTGMHLQRLESMAAEALEKPILSFFVLLFYRIIKV